MNIVFLNARYFPHQVGGPAHSTRFVAEQMVRDGHRATVICRSPEPGVHEENVEGVDIVRAGMDVGPAPFLDMYGDIFERLRPQVLHVFHPPAFPLLRLAQATHARGIPIVQTLLSFDFLCGHSFMRDGVTCTSQCHDCREMTGPGRKYLGMVDAAVGVSRYLLGVYRDSGSLAETTLQRCIPQSYVPPDSPRDATPAGSTLRLGFIGRLDPLKGLDPLIATLLGPQLRDRDWTLQIAGTGDNDYVSALQRDHTDERIRFLGFVEPASLFADIDVLVAPALWQEPFGRIVIEAYAHGIPVIASRRGGMNETVVDGETGFLYEPETDGDLIRILLDCLHRPQKLRDMTQSALNRWRDHYTPQVVAGAYRDVYVQAKAKQQGASSA